MCIRLNPFATSFNNHYNHGNCNSKTQTIINRRTEIAENDDEATNSGDRLIYGGDVVCSSSPSSSSSSSSSTTGDNSLSSSMSGGLDSCDEEMSRIYCRVKLTTNNTTNPHSSSSNHFDNNDTNSNTTVAAESLSAQARLTFACSNNRPCLDLEKMRKVCVDFSKFQSLFFFVCCFCSLLIRTLGLVRIEDLVKEKKNSLIVIFLLYSIKKEI